MSIRLTHPVPSGYRTDGFGWRAAIPGVIGAMLHDGQDYAAPAGTPIRAAHDGVIVASGRDPWGWTGAGYGAIIRSLDGRYETRYWHMLGLPLEAGTRVYADKTVIGHVGSTGNSTGPHLHFTLAIGGAPVNPLPYITASLPPKPKPAPKPKEDPMPKRHSIPEYNPNRTFPPGKWSTLPINKKGHVTIAFSGKKPIRGTTSLVVHAEGEFLLRFVYDEVNAKADTVVKRRGSVKARYNRAGIHAWPITLPAKTDKLDTRLRAQIYPLGRKALKVTAILPTTDYWEE